MNYIGFLGNKSFSGFLDSCWDNDKKFYKQVDGEMVIFSYAAQSMVFHTYGYIACGEETHRERAGHILDHILKNIGDDGRINESIDRKITATATHPGFIFIVCKCLGIIYTHLSQLSLTCYEERIKKAVVDIVENNPEIEPGEIYGADQSLRFEISGYYFAYLVTKDVKYLEIYKKIFDSGIFSYTHDTHSHKPRVFSFRPGVQAAVLHPDFTFNYGCGTGVEDRVSTNTHTPAYYLTEIDGFLFTYLHGLKNNILERKKEWDEFCVKYAQGIYKDLSRAGRMSCDIDGYGLHRAWYSKVIFEGLPLVCCAGLGPVAEYGIMKKHFKWYSDRFIENFISSDYFKLFGVPEHQPYGHNITTERQFDIFNCVEIYAKVALYLYEFEIDKTESVEPAAFFAYSWWHNWLRISTPVYETSFTAVTSGCNTVKSKDFGDPNLGTIEGGAALTVLFAGDNLIYAASAEPEYMFDMFVQDRNGRIARSSGTLFGEDYSFQVETHDGRILNSKCFESYGMPVKEELGQKVHTVFHKHVPELQTDFSVYNSYESDTITIRQMFSVPEGHSMKEGYFAIPFPKLSPLVIVYHKDTEFEIDFSCEQFLDIRDIKAFKCRVKGVNYMVEIVKAPEYKHPQNTLICTGSRGYYREPGGENSFCPYPLGVVKIGAGADYMHTSELIVKISFPK